MFFPQKNGHFEIQLIRLKLILLVISATAAVMVFSALELAASLELRTTAALAVIAFALFFLPKDDEALHMGLLFQITLIEFALALQIWFGLFFVFLFVDLVFVFVTRKKFQRP